MSTIEFGGPDDHKVIFDHNEPQDGTIFIRDEKEKMIAIISPNEIPGLIKLLAECMAAANSKKLQLQRKLDALKVTLNDETEE